MANVDWFQIHVCLTGKIFKPNNRKMKKLNKKVLSLIALLFIVVASGNIANAQQRGLNGPPPIPSQKEIEKMVDDLSDELSLDQEQEATISLFYLAHFEEVRGKMEAGRPSRDEMEKLKSELEEEVKDNLTDAQVTKYEAYLKNASPQNQKRRPGGGR